MKVAVAEAVRLWRKTAPHEEPNLMTRGVAGVTLPRRGAARRAFALRQCVLNVLERELLVFEQQRVSPQPENIHRSIAARQVLFSEPMPSRVLKPRICAATFGEPSVAMHVAAMPSISAEQPVRIAFISLLSDEECERFRSLLEYDLTSFTAVPGLIGVHVRRVSIR